MGIKTAGDQSRLFDAKNLQCPLITIDSFLRDCNIMSDGAPCIYDGGTNTISIYSKTFLTPQQMEDKRKEEESKKLDNILYKIRKTIKTIDFYIPLLFLCNDSDIKKLDEFKKTTESEIGRPQQISLEVISKMENKYTELLNVISLAKKRIYIRYKELLESKSNDIKSSSRNYTS